MSAASLNQLAMLSGSLTTLQTTRTGASIRVALRFLAYTSSEAFIGRRVGEALKVAVQDLSE
jgi:hypothetical protein